MSRVCFETALKLSSFQNMPLTFVQHEWMVFMTSGDEGMNECV